MTDLAPIPADLIRSSLKGIAPYEAGKPVEEVQRELGLERVAKLASNESPFGPLPAVHELLAGRLYELNRYPDSGAYRFRAALAERHGVDIDEIAHGAGADGIMGYLSLALLDPGDEVVFGWPSFTSYMLHTLKVGATPRPVPLREHRYDLEALLAAVGPRTKIVYICSPNNPTGTMSTRAELDAYFERVPERVLTVIDQSYFEYVEEPDYPDAIEEYVKEGARAMVLRSFSKVFGLAGLRIGYAVASRELCAALAKVRPAFDLSSIAQEAAIVSLRGEEAAAEIERRVAYNRVARLELERILGGAGLEPLAGAVANFVFVDLGRDSRTFFEELMRAGAIVRPLHGFGAPTAIRVTVGSGEEHALLREALATVRPR
jgi:histidinol-phosphate aminotransferase